MKQGLGMETHPDKTTATITLRLATLEDVHALTHLEETCFDTDRLQRHHYRALLHKNTSLILIAEKTRQLVGSIVVLFRKNSRTARLYSLAILPCARQYGIATKLLGEAERIARARGCEKIILEVREDNRIAMQFYLKHHYTLFGKYITFYEDGSDALRMQKELYDRHATNSTACDRR